MKKTLLLLASFLTGAFVSLRAETHETAISLCPFYHGRVAAVSLTYDDGLLEHYTLVAPELEKRGFRGSFWIIGNVVGRTGIKNGDRMTWEQIAELEQRGHEMGSHTWSHPNCRRVGVDAFMADVARNDSAFLSRLGHKPLTLAYPYNSSPEEAVALVEQGRIASRTKQVGHGQNNNKSTLEKMTAWMNQLIQRGEWGVTMTHAILDGYDKWFHPEELWQFYDTLQAHTDQLWVGTFADVASYTRELAATTLTVERRGKATVATPRCTLDATIFRHPLTLRISSPRKPRKLRAVQNGRTLPVELRQGDAYIDFSPWEGEVVITPRQ